LYNSYFLPATVLCFMFIYIFRTFFCDVWKLVGKLTCLRSFQCITLIRSYFTLISPRSFPSPCFGSWISMYDGCPMSFALFNVVLTLYHARLCDCALLTMFLLISSVSLFELRSSGILRFNSFRSFPIPFLFLFFLGLSLPPALCLASRSTCLCPLIAPWTFN